MFKWISLSEINDFILAIALLFIGQASLYIYYYFDEKHKKIQFYDQQVQSSRLR